MNKPINARQFFMRFIQDRSPSHLASIRHSGHLGGCGRVRPQQFARYAMLFHPKRESGLDRLADRLRLAPATTSDLFRKIIADSCTRLLVMKRAGKAGRLDQLIEAGAWTDAALALIALELPAWQLRRLTYDDGEWHCSLSKHCNLPAAFDDTADGSHEELPLAILSAFVEARRTAGDMEEAGTTSPEMPPKTDYAISTENFF